MRESEPKARPTKQVLGIPFFEGSAGEAVAYLVQRGGMLTVPAAPSLIALQDDADYRSAVAEADLAIADSGWMVLFWGVLRREKISRISGLTYLKKLLEHPAVRSRGAIFWVLPSERAKAKLLSWVVTQKIETAEQDCYVAPNYGDRFQDRQLLAKIDNRRPSHIVIAVGGGMQDKVGSYLKRNCSYRPAIHCLGAALGFLTGDQVSIPTWADRLYLGWLFRLIAQPTIFVPRLWSVRKLPWLIIRYGRELPPLRKTRPRPVNTDFPHFRRW